MKLGVGTLFVGIGLVILWAAVTGRLSNVGAAWAALKGDDPAATVHPASGGAAAPTASRVAAALNVPAGFPAFPILPSLN